MSYKTYLWILPLVEISRWFKSPPDDRMLHLMTWKLEHPDVESLISIECILGSLHEKQVFPSDWKEVANCVLLRWSPWKVWYLCQMNRAVVYQYLQVNGTGKVSRGADARFEWPRSLMFLEQNMAWKMRILFIIYFIHVRNSWLCLWHIKPKNPSMVSNIIQC